MGTFSIIPIHSRVVPWNLFSSTSLLAAKSTNHNLSLSNRLLAVCGQYGLSMSPIDSEVQLTS